VDTRKTFVLWVGSGQEEALEGRLEEVDTGRELRFRSADQLIAFLEQCVKSDRTNGDEGFRK